MTEAVKQSMSVTERRAGPLRTAGVGPVRTCVGCGRRDVPPALVRLVLADGEVVFDLESRAAGRGAYLHPRPGCLTKASRGLGRAFRGRVSAAGVELGARLIVACEKRMGELLLAAKRLDALATRPEAVAAALEAIAGGAAPPGLGVVIVAVDAGAAARQAAVLAAIAAGGGIAWGTKSSLGGLLGGDPVAICAVCHAGTAAELKRVRAAADAGAAMTREGAECSSRFPEAR